MRAADLRHEITIESAALTFNDAGESSKPWTYLADAYASIRPVSARERLANDQVSAVATHEIRIRYNYAVTTECRIVFGERIFEIESVINTDERNIELVLLCTEQQGGPST